MTKLLLVMPYFYPHKGGSQKYAEELYVHLLAKYPQQYSVDVLAYNTDHAPVKESYRGLTIYRIPCWQLIPTRFCLPNPISLIKILKKLSVNKYNYVNSQLVFFDPCWWLWAYAHIIGAKSIFTEHVAMYPVHQNKVVEIISKLVDKTIGRLAVNFYDIITVTNKAAIKFLQNEIHIKKPINLIYGGVDTSFFTPITHPSTQTTITFIGRVIWTKGITYLYQSIKNILPLIPQNVHFIIAGGGELESTLKKDILKDKLSDRITLTGFISYQQVRDILQKTDIFVNPSHHNEGFPNTILEAGASGNFVIATDNAGTKEVIQNKITGLLIPQKDQQALDKSLLWAINHPQERKVIANNLHQLMVNQFDWNIIATNFHQLLSR